MNFERKGADYHDAGHQCRRWMQREHPVLDIRSLFPNPGPEVTVNMLCEAITSLVKTGNVSMYEADDDSGQTRYLVHLSASDSWAMPPSDGAAVGGSAAGAAAGGAARRDSMSD
jgi:hypothetical protein